MNFRFDLVQHFSSLEEIETQKCKVTSPKSHSGKAETCRTWVV